jgi:hypothetical protein
LDLFDTVNDAPFLVSVQSNADDIEPVYITARVKRPGTYDLDLHIGYDAGSGFQTADAGTVRLCK